MRKLTSFAVIGTVAIVLAGCGSPGAGAAGDVLFLAAGGGVAAVEPGTSEPIFLSRNATPSSDWSTVVQRFTNGNTTRLVAVDPASGFELWEHVVGGDKEVKIVSNDGRLVALGPARERNFGLGRARTQLVVAGRGSPEPRLYDLAGNFEPEAFSIDGKSLFLVSYIPARDPVNYQVRRLDLVTGDVEGVYTPDAHLQQSMGGTARIQATSPDGRRLYTLYTLAGNRKEEARAFIHVLSLDELWAHCIELPSGFARSNNRNAAITVSPDGGRVYLVNSGTDRLVEVDTATLKATRTTTVDLDTSRATHAVHGPDERLYVASGVDITAVDLDALVTTESWQMFSNVTGLQTGGDPRRLYVGVKDSIVVLDVSTGLRLDVLDPSGFGQIDRFGRVMPAPEEEVEEAEEFTCAC